jgi:hypothetical protein
MHAFLSSCLHACALVCLFVYVPVSSFFYMPVCLQHCMPVCLSVSMSAFLCVCVCVPVFYPSACVFVCLGVQKFGTGALRPSMCRGRVLTDSVGRTLGRNSSAVGRPFRVRFCRQLNPLPRSWQAEFRGELWGSDFWWREGLRGGALWRPQNAEFTVLNLTWFRSEIVQLSCGVAFCGCMETSEEGFLVRDFFKHLSAADINYYFMSTACLPDLFATYSVDFGECIW